MYCKKVSTLLLYFIMLVKNLLKRLEKVSFFILLLSLSFVLFNSKSFVVLGQESTGTTWANIDGVEQLTIAEDTILEDKDNLLFVSTDCEGCTELVSDLQETGVLPLSVYLLDIDTYTDFQSVLKDAYDSCTDFDKDIGTPFLYSDGACYGGYDEIHTKLVALQIEAKSNDGSADFDILAAYEGKLEVEEYINKSVSERLMDDTAVWEWIVLGVIVFLAIGFLIYWIIKRKDVGQKRKAVFAALQFGLVLLPTLYLGFKINTAVNLGNEYSSAGNCLDTSAGCASWAEREAARAEKAEESGDYSSKTARNAKKFVDANGGLGSAQLQNAVEAGNAATMAKSAEIYAAAGGNSAKAVKIAEDVNAGNFTLDINNPNIVTLSDGTEVPVSAVSSLQPGLVYIGQVKGILGSDVCSTVVECETKLRELNSLTKEAYAADTEKKAGEWDKTYIYQIDSVTGQVVQTPVNTYVIDGYCEATVGLDGGGSTTGFLCECDNGIGGSAYTYAAFGTSCDAVCRMRFPCDDCNPPEPPQPPPPEITGEPYCGDGELGNTPGEECEYGDPSGVTCSWNVCDSNCKCPEIEEPYCGDGIFGNTAGEECEIGNPDGVTCSWTDCNHVICKCVEPGCGDGILDSGEQCERDNPDGFTCLWETECDQQSCSCPEEPSPYCGDGNLDAGELCEVGNPDGVTCTWDECSKISCTCPETPEVPTTPGGSSPQTGLFDSTQTKIIVGFMMMVLGFFLTPFTKTLSHYYMKVSDGVVRIGKKRFEDKVLDDK